MRKLASCTYKVWKVTSGIASVFLILNMLIIIANIIMRRVFNTPILGSTELVSYASLITASLALAQNEWFDGNIRMTLVVESIPHKAAKVLHFVDYIICSVVFVYVSYLLVNQAVNKFIVADVSTDLHMPIFIFSAVLAFGFILLTVSIIIKMVILGYGVITGDEINLKCPSGTEDKPLEES